MTQFAGLAMGLGCVRIRCSGVIWVVSRLVAEPQFRDKRGTR